MPIHPSPAVLRACDVLEVLASSPSEPLSVSEVARRVSAPRATCDAVLLALAERNFVTRHDDLRYELGRACIALGDAARTANSVLAAAAAEGEDLARRLSLCGAIATRDGDETRVAEVFDYGPPFGIRTQVGQSIPLRPPFGAVFVAWESPDGIRQWLGRADFLDDDEESRYRAALDAVRARGYSVTTAIDRRPALMSALEALVEQPDADDVRRARDEVMRQMTHSEYLPAGLDDSTVRRVSQLSGPVFDHTGQVAAAIMLLGPDYDVTSEEISALGTQLQQAATRATRAAGGRARDGAGA